MEQTSLDIACFVGNSRAGSSRLQALGTFACNCKTAQVGAPPGAPCRSKAMRARAAADGLATKQAEVDGSAEARAERGVPGAAAAATPASAAHSPPLSTSHLWTDGDAVAAQRQSSRALTARRRTGCPSHASSSLTRLARHVLHR